MADASRGAWAAEPILVLDTNVVLDWLLFRDARCAVLVQAIRVGQVRWVASPAMRAELHHVLARGLRSGRAVDAASILQAWDRWATMVAAGDGPAPPSMRCTDADDQKFIDLALQVRAQALLSRDRALLKLRRRAATHGLRILSADAWQPQGTDTTPEAVSPG